MSVLVFSLFFGFLLPLRNILVCGLDTLSCECVCVHGPVLSRVYFLLVPSAPRIDLNLNDKKNLYFIVSFSKYFCYNFSSGVFFFFFALRSQSFLTPLLSRLSDESHCHLFLAERPVARHV